MTAQCRATLSRKTKFHKPYSVEAKRNGENFWSIVHSEILTPARAERIKSGYQKQDEYNFARSALSI